MSRNGAENQPYAERVPWAVLGPARGARGHGGRWSTHPAAEAAGVGPPRECPRTISSGTAQTVSERPRTPVLIKVARQAVIREERGHGSRTRVLALLSAAGQAGAFNGHRLTHRRGKPVSPVIAYEVLPTLCTGFQNVCA